MARITCPPITCRSHDCTPVTESKRYKTGKGLVGGVAGGLLLGPIGAAAGLASGMNGRKKVKFVCNKCGKIFEASL